jgi:16S rRNA (guanine527-N7)-methyltransferase
VSAAEDVFGTSYESASQYVDILASRGIEWGLIGPREGDRLWDRHVLNSAALADLIPAGSTVADVGSGAGLPGLPLAILRPDLQVALVEPLLRRSTFLTGAVEELGLTDRVTVVRARAEDHREQYDVVAARALAPLERLITWCDPLRSPSGVILALKGRSAVDELEGAQRILAQRRLTGEVLSVRAHPSVEPTTVVRLAGRRP